MKLTKRKDVYGRTLYEFSDAIVRGEWSNFSGRPDRNFGKQGFDLDLSKDPDVAEVLQQEGFNVSIRVDKRDPQAAPYTHMTILLPYNTDPKKQWLCPDIRVVSNGVMNELTSETVDTLDKSIIDKCNLTVRMRTGTYQNRPYVQAQLVDGTFYISGSREYEPSYRQSERERYQKPPKVTDEYDDCPF